MLIQFCHKLLPTKKTSCKPKGEKEFHAPENCPTPPLKNMIRNCDVLFVFRAPQWNLVQELLLPTEQTVVLLQLMMKQQVGAFNPRSKIHSCCVAHTITAAVT